MCTKKALPGGFLVMMIKTLFFSLHRFATEVYTTDPDNIGNNFIHLTNYSINRDSENFEQNTDPHSARVRFSEVKTLPKNGLGFKVDAEQPLEVST